MTRIEIRSVEWNGEARMALESAAAHDTTGGFETLQDIEKQGALFEATVEGEPVLYYVLSVNHHTSGNEGVILAASGSKPGSDLTATVLPMIENQFVNCRAVMLQTRRRGLVKKLAAQGYRIDGYIMRKTLNVSSN